jgi:hypothetical protein
MTRTLCWQVPQFILDDCVARGEGGACRLICTQPRRISAVGVAERVARERCEAVGQTVGYRIRLEARESAATRLSFCTTGVLLRRLLDDPDLRGVSHVVVDEVRAFACTCTHHLYLSYTRARARSRTHAQSGTRKARLRPAAFREPPPAPPRIRVVSFTLARKSDTVAAESAGMADSRGVCVCASGARAQRGRGLPPHRPPPPPGHAPLHPIS